MFNFRNRVESRLSGRSANISSLFSAQTSTEDPINSFNNVKSIREAINHHLEFVIKEAKMQGANEALEQRREHAKKAIGDYVLVVTKIVEVAYEVVKTQMAEEKIDIRIVEARTIFDFITKEIKILFVIDADENGEKEFSDLIIASELFVWDRENYFADILFINSRGSALDQHAIECDYPFVRKL